MKFVKLSLVETKLQKKTPLQKIGYLSNMRFVI